MNTITTQIQKLEYTIINKLGASDTGERERNERDRIERLYLVQMTMLKLGRIA